MNIAFVHTVFPGGGAERVTRDIASGILNSSPEGYSFFVYTPSVREVILTEDYSRCFKGISEYSCRNEEKEIEELVRRDGIDVIVQIARRLKGIEGIRKRTGCKVVLANHGEPFHLRYEIIHRRQRKPWRRFLWNMGLRYIYEDFGYAMRRSVRSCMKDYRSCDVYTVLCEDYRTRICEELGLSASEAHIVAINNSEPVVEDVCFDKEKMFLFSGRFEQFSKRVDRLMRIWGKVQDRLPDWRLVLAGDGYDLQMIKDMASEMNLKNIEFIGFQDDMAPLYRKASVLCLTSQTEGWGLCLTEAQANGVIPVAFASTAAVRYILSPDGENGFLVENFDEDEFASVLVKLAEADEDHIMQLRRNVVAKAKTYSPDVIAAQWKEVFDSLND
jgi:glycosyltransferase involved in cell wall biosynthesis